MALNGVLVDVGDVCRHGMMQVDKVGPGLVKKPSRFMSNSQEIMKRIAIRCQGGHRHITLEGSARTSKAQKYPLALCREVCIGIRKQCVLDSNTGRQLAVGRRAESRRP